MIETGRMFRGAMGSYQWHVIIGSLVGALEHKKACFSQRRAIGWAEQRTVLGFKSPSETMHLPRERQAKTGLRSKARQNARNSRIRCRFTAAYGPVRDLSV